MRPPFESSSQALSMDETCSTQSQHICFNAVPSMMGWLVEDLKKRPLPSARSMTVGTDASKYVLIPTARAMPSLKTGMRPHPEGLHDVCYALAQERHFPFNAAPSIWLARQYTTTSSCLAIACASCLLASSSLRWGSNSVWVKSHKWDEKLSVSQLTTRSTKDPKQHQSSHSNSDAMLHQ